MASIKKYNGSTFVDAAIRKYSTASEIITPPTTIYADGSNITTYTIKGNTVQNGTPTPSNPVDVVGVGTLDSGDYKIPISSGGVTTNIYLGSTVSNRWIAKIVLTGQETITATGTNYSVPISPYIIDRNDLLCSHFFVGAYSGALIEGQIRGSGSPANSILINYDNGSGGADSFKNWLLQQYNNNTPVVIFYVKVNQAPTLNNEPLMKIGDYADTLSNAASIPTTEGANSITVDTTVQPSEFTATWTGWHDASVKEWDGTQRNE